VGYWLDHYAARRLRPEAEIVARQQVDTTLQEALQGEPRLVDVVSAARRQRNLPGYSRLRAYPALKRGLYPLVGMAAQVRELRTSNHYDAVLVAINEWLPNDVQDLRDDGSLDASGYAVWCEDAEATYGEATPGDARGLRFAWDTTDVDKHAASGPHSLEYLVQKTMARLQSTKDGADGDRDA